MVNLREITEEIKNALTSVTEDAYFEAREIVKSVLLVSNNDIIFGKEVSVSVDQKKLIDDIVSKRKERYPLQYLLGSWDFFGREFTVGEGVLIPRADTEISVEKALEFLKGFTSPKILDLCSGSGCIAITLKLEKDNASVTAVEKSEKAFGFLAKNCKNLKADVNCVLDDALSCDVGDGYDLIISNPPYLTKKDMQNLQAEVRYEPEMALYGEDDGLFFYRELTRIYKSKMNSGGMLIYEFGDGQHSAVAEILSENGFESICLAKDYNGIIRCVTAIKP